MFYLALDGTVRAAEVQAGDTFEAGPPIVLFQTNIAVPASPLEYYFDASADGQRFLVNEFVPAAAPEPGAAYAPPTPITVVLNWKAALGP